MVIYCCVKGCNSNGNNKKKDPNTMLSFHAFPHNLEQKTKWAKAIGRPNWIPSGHVRICSMHFNHDQINYEGCRTRIKNDAIPTKNLPLNSNFEATGVLACRICLATDLKLHSLQDSQLGNCMDSISGFNTNCNIEGLPQYVCYQCAPCLIKFYKFVERGMMAQATLLDIFANNGEITTDLIMQQNREKLNLTSSLKCCKTDKYYYFKEYEDDDAIHKTNSIDYIDYNDIDVKTEEKYLQVDVLALNEQTDNLNNENVVQEIDLKEEMLFDDNLENENPVQVNNHKEELFSNNKSKTENAVKENNLKEEMSSDDDFNDSRMESPYGISSDSETNEQEILKCNVKNKKLKSKDKLLQNKFVKKRDTDITSDIHTYFDIVQLSLEEQIDEWKKAPLKTPMTSETIYKCEVCHKLFAQSNTYRVHVGSHDPSRGEFECPVCKLRFKTDILLKSHGNRAHSKKYYCKTCPKSFNSVRVAKQHHRWHSGHKYKCTSCPYKSAHESALGVHMRRAHAHTHVCAECGRACVSRRGLTLHRATAHRDVKETSLTKAYRCEECNINFASEGARRVHLLTAKQHRKTSDVPLAEELKNTCSKCGVECTSHSALVSHTRAEHPRPKPSKSKAQDTYPIQCQLCDETISSRRHHAQHVRRKHPKDADTYRPVVTCVCDTCGRGFQNTTQLQIHQLRHSAPTIRCASCPRLLYDKYALARHEAIHVASKPHQCRICGKAFKHRNNLDRHCSSVHSDVTPYECSMCGKKFKYSSSVKLHIRSVHFKLPVPPRKRKSKTTKVTNEAVC